MCFDKGPLPLQNIQPLGGMQIPNLLLRQNTIYKISATILGESKVQEVAMDSLL